MPSRIKCWYRANGRGDGGRGDGGRGGGVEAMGWLFRPPRRGPRLDRPVSGHPGTHPADNRDRPATASRTASGSPVVAVSRERLTVPTDQGSAARSGSNAMPSYKTENGTATPTAGIST